MTPLHCFYSFFVSLFPSPNSYKYKHIHIYILYMSGDLRLIVNHTSPIILWWHLWVHPVTATSPTLSLLPSLTKLGTFFSALSYRHLLLNCLHTLMSDLHKAQLCYALSLLAIQVTSLVSTGSNFRMWKEILLPLILNLLSAPRLSKYIFSRPISSGH